MCSCMRWLEQIYFFNFSFLLLLLLLLLSSPTKGSVAELKVNRCFMSFNLSVVAAATVIAVKSAVVSRPTSAVVCFHFGCCCYYFVNVICFLFCVCVYVSHAIFMFLQFIFVLARFFCIYISFAFSCEFWFAQRLFGVSCFVVVCLFSSWFSHMCTWEHMTQLCNVKSTYRLLSAIRVCGSRFVSTMSLYNLNLYALNWV